MARVSQSDLRGLLDVVRKIESIDDLGTFSAAVLRSLQELVRYDNAGQLSRHPARPAWSLTVEPATVAPATDVAAFGRTAHENPILFYYDDHPRQRGRALKSSDVLSAGEVHRLTHYDEFLKPLEIEHQLGISVIVPGPLVFGVALNRSRRDFSERDRMVLDLLRPHLAQAYRNLEARTRLRQALTALEQGDERAERAVVLLRSDGGIAFASGAAGRWLEAYFGGEQEIDHLPETLQAWIRRSRGRLNGDHEVPPPAAPLVSERSGGRLTVRLLPPTAPGELAALVLEERRAGVSSDEIAALGLSTRESEVLALVAAGRTNAEIALMLGISARTVVKHLEHIFAKLGVATRTAAAARAFEACGYRIADARVLLADPTEAERPATTLGGRATTSASE
jgi:DNA-binding NarL/FixJ family response regulator